MLYDGACREGADGALEYCKVGQVVKYYCMLEVSEGVSNNELRPTY